MAKAVARTAVAAAEVVRRAQPTEDSERRRAGVIDYARKLIGAALGCEVSACIVSPRPYAERWRAARWRGAPPCSRFSFKFWLPNPAGGCLIGFSLLYPRRLGVLVLS